MGTTLTLATGRQIDVKGDYDEIVTYLGTRTLTEDDGKRELNLADGRKMTVATAGILAVEERETAETKIGFA